MERFGKTLRFSWGGSGVGKQLPWHSPQRAAQGPSAQCAKADLGVPESVDKGDSQCHCSRVARLDKHAENLLVVLHRIDPSQCTIHSTNSSP